MGDIQIIQEKLIQLNITIVGTPDGKFGKNTSKAILIFKKEYDRSKACEDTLAHYNGHGLNWKQEETEDSTVERNCIMAIDEAIVSGWKYSGCSIDTDKFIEEYRKSHTSLIGWYDKNRRTKKYEKIIVPKLNSSSSNNLKRLINELIIYYKQSKYECSIPKLSYILATIRLESYQWRKQEFFGLTSEDISYKEAEIDYGCGSTARR